MVYDTLIVGGGIAGLTAGAYLSKSGIKTLIAERQPEAGGLVNSFKYKDFTFDGGIRALENSGILFPMLRQLGIDVEFIKSNVTVGIENDMVELESEKSIDEYTRLLIKKFPGRKQDVLKIIDEIKKIMKYMDVLYGIDNPLFLDIKKDKKYLIKKVLPNIFSYIFTLKKIQKLMIPVDEYLREITTDAGLTDIISQHFFEKTPAFFAMSYFSLYLDYNYPKGGTGSLIKKMTDYIESKNGEIVYERKITDIDYRNSKATDDKGNVYSYKYLIWACDINSFYNAVNYSADSNDKISESFLNQKSLISDKKGGDSVLTLYLTADIDKKYFEKICSPHFFYTPEREGLSKYFFDVLKTGEKSKNSKLNSIRKHCFLFATNPHVFLRVPADFLHYI